MPSIFSSSETFQSWAVLVWQIGRFNTPLGQAGGQHQVGMTEEEQLLVVDRLHKVSYWNGSVKRQMFEAGSQNQIRYGRFCCDGRRKRSRMKFLQSTKRLFGVPCQGFSDGFIKKSQAMLPRHLLIRLCTFEKCAIIHICSVPKPPSGQIFQVGTVFLNSGVVDESIVRTCGKIWVLDDILTKLYATKHRVLIFSQMVRLLNILEVKLPPFRYTARCFSQCEGGCFSALTAAQAVRKDSEGRNSTRPHLLISYSHCRRKRVVWASTCSLLTPLSYTILIGTRRMMNRPSRGGSLQLEQEIPLKDSAGSRFVHRAHRIGQKREVLILRLVTPDTVEEKIITAAGVKLDKDALIIKSGMFYDTGYDLEDERRSRCDLRCAETFLQSASYPVEERSAPSDDFSRAWRCSAAGENRGIVFVQNGTEEGRRFTGKDALLLLGHGDLLLEEVLPNCLAKISKEGSGMTISWLNQNIWREEIGELFIARVVCGKLRLATFPPTCPVADRSNCIPQEALHKPSNNRRCFWAESPVRLSPHSAVAAALRECPRRDIPVVSSSVPANVSQLHQEIRRS
eukprot:284818087_4